MAKLTKDQRRQLEDTLASLDRAIAYVMADETAICKRRAKATTIIDFTRERHVPKLLRTKAEVRFGDYTALTEVAKEIGSDLTGLFNARRTLAAFLNGAGK
jgi:hypothetical protein